MIECPWSETDAFIVSKHCYAVEDAYPVSRGHALIIPKRNVTSFFSLSADEQADCWDLIAEVRDELTRGCDGFTIGINDGVAAGQSVARAHIHIIPRRFGDRPNPRGGIRAVIPGKADWSDKWPT